MDALLSPYALANVGQNDVYLYLQLIVVFTLLLLLIQRELASNVQEQFARSLWRVLLVGIVPLLFAFLFILSWRLGPVP
jgi:asparagine N-glycosylation enzyme membrane subunit Stt3